MKDGDLERLQKIAVMDNDRMVERRLLLEELRYSNVIQH